MRLVAFFAYFSGCFDKNKIKIFDPLEQSGGGTDNRCWKLGAPSGLHLCIGRNKLALCNEAVASKHEYAVSIDVAGIQEPGIPEMPFD
jgi:hypothetical protein